MWIPLTQNQANILQVDGREALPNIRPREADDPQVEAAIRNYETAYRMQSAVPELLDLRGETDATKALYGLDSSHKDVAS